MKVFKTSLIMLLTMLAISPAGTVKAHGQSKDATAVSIESGRDPFLLPPGIRLVSKKETGAPVKEIPLKSKPSEVALKVNSILITDHIRLTSIDGHILSVGDSIYGEKILEIHSDRVIVEKGAKTRTLLLSQSPIRVTIEEK